MIPVESESFKKTALGLHSSGDLDGGEPLVLSFESVNTERLFCKSENLKVTSTETCQHTLIQSGILGVSEMLKVVPGRVRSV